MATPYAIASPTSARRYSAGGTNAHPSRTWHVAGRRWREYESSVASLAGGHDDRGRLCPPAPVEGEFLPLHSEAWDHRRAGPGRRPGPQQATTPEALADQTRRRVPVLHQLPATNPARLRRLQLDPPRNPTPLKH